MKPKIGILICGLRKDRQFVPNAYIQSVRYSGGLPLLLPLLRSGEMLRSYLSLCDGFLFCGGGDITPILFKQEPAKGNGQTNLPLDLFQLRMMKEILPTKKPILAICRGMQILNVACGGTILQDIWHRPGKTLNHMQQSENAGEISHRIFTCPDTLLARCLGAQLLVNSFHHQALDAIGEHLTVTATAPDNIPEAVEHTHHPFAVGVQWHPECMYPFSKKMRRLFSTFIRHA